MTKNTNDNSIKSILWFFLLPLSLQPAAVHAKQNFPIMLAKSHTSQNVTGWLASEKLDGVRGYWDGEVMLSKNGYDYQAPKNFIADFPDFPLDGELYIGRGKFDETSGIVRKGEDWTDIKYYVFDVPDVKGGLIERLDKLKIWLAANPNKHIFIVEQIPIASINDAHELRKNIESKKGEGVMLRNPNTPYLRTRTESILKLKSFQDGECTVIGYSEGKGKYTGKLGALVCQLSDGRKINIGSGFTDAERDSPPDIGCVITFRHNGLTKTGKPRFARFWRIRE